MFARLQYLSLEKDCFQSGISLHFWAFIVHNSFTMQTILNFYLHYPTNILLLHNWAESGLVRLPTHQHSRIRVRVLFWNWYQSQLIPHPLLEAIPKAPTEPTQVAQPLPRLNNPEATIYHTMFIMEPRVICAQ